MVLNMKKIELVLLAGCAVLGIAGCSSPAPDLTRGGCFGDRDMFASGEIKMPVNYNKDNFRKLLMGVVVQNVKIDSDGERQLVSENPAYGLSVRLQTEMVKLKRFSVFSAFNNGGVTFFKALGGGPDMPDEISRRQLDLVLTLNLILSVEKHERVRDNLLIYEVDIDASCEDLRTHEVMFAEKSRGQVKRVEKISVTGNKLGGYWDKDTRQAFQQAALEAISSIAVKLGNYYPVGGHIIGFAGDRMTLDCGFLRGVGKDMQMVVYTSVNGVDIPLAVAEASPADTSANLKIWRWNTDDPYAESIIEQMKEDADWLENHECYAVSLRMAVPPEWDRDVIAPDRVK